MGARLVRLLTVLMVHGLASLGFGHQAPASEDWPQWRGLDRSNASRETGLLTEWPTNGPPLVWKVTGLGQGISSVSVAGGHLFTVGNLDGSEVVFALNAQTGEKILARRVGATFDENPLMRWLTQRTPTVDCDRLYTLTVNGEGLSVCSPLTPRRMVSVISSFCGPRRSNNWAANSRISASRFWTRSAAGGPPLPGPLL